MIHFVHGGLYTYRAFSLEFKVEQVHESRLGHGRVSGVVVCGLQESAKSSAW